MRRETWSGWRAAGHGVAYAIMGVILAVALVLAIGYTVSGAQRTYSGTFTQSGCDFDARRGCLPVGMWASDDGSLVKRDIRLDGETVGTGGTVRAVYTPTGFNNDADNNIVHVPGIAAFRNWISWGFVVVILGLMLSWAWRWRRPTSRPRPTSSPFNSPTNEA